jgi:putative photosynthetic complex assembly protein 2
MTVPKVAETAAVPSRSNAVQLAAMLRRHSVMLVLCFWWTATGVLYALQRNVWTRGAALVGAMGCLAMAGRLLVQSRDDTTSPGALRAFFAGALAWTAIITLFFEGWIVGPGLESLGAETRGWRGAWSAIQATWHWEALALVTIGVGVWATRTARSRLALWTLLLFWGAHQTAKLNLFVGVVNSGAEIFPPYLAHLVRYFGPAHNSPLLGVTIVAYATLAVWMLVPVGRIDDGTRSRRLMIAALAALAAIEHGFLATRLPIMLWELFLRVGRG